MEQYIALRATGTERILVSDVVDRFAKRPYGWPDAEILLLVGQLAAMGRISLQLNGGSLQLKMPLSLYKTAAVAVMFRLKTPD